MINPLFPPLSFLLSTQLAGVFDPVTTTVNMWLIFGSRMMCWVFVLFRASHQEELVPLSSTEEPALRASAISVSTSKFLGTEGFSLWQGSLKPSYTQQYKATKLSSTASRLSAKDGIGYTRNLSLWLCVLFLVASGRGKG